MVAERPTPTGIVRSVGLIDDIRTGAYRGDGTPALATHGRAPSLAIIARHVADGAHLLPEVREFLDAAGRADDRQLIALTNQEPVRVDPRTDALLAAVAEHLLAIRGLPAPTWAAGSDRSLDRFWFVSSAPGLRAVAIAQTPAALKRRGILWPARSLERV